MTHDRNPTEAVDDPKPNVDRDPNDSPLDPEDPQFVKWVQRHLDFPLTQDHIDGLRMKLEGYGDEVGLEELSCLVQPTRADSQRLLYMAEYKFTPPTNDSRLDY